MRQPQGWADRLAALLSLGLLLGFVLPWAEIGFLRVRGYQLPELVGGMAGLGRLLAAGSPAAALHLTWLVPLTALPALLLRLAGRRPWSLELVAALLPWAFALVGLHRFGAELHQFLGAGAWLSLACGLPLLLLAAVRRGG